MNALRSVRIEGTHPYRACRRRRAWTSLECSGRWGESFGLLGVRCDTGTPPGVAGLEIGRCLPRPYGQFFAVLAADMDRPQQRFADGAGMRQPVGAAGIAEAVAFGAGVIFVDHRPPPFDHLALDLDRARRRRVDRGLHARHVVFRAHLRRQLQHAHEHGRHPLAGIGFVCLDVLQRLPLASGKCSIAITVPPRRCNVMQ